MSVNGSLRALVMLPACLLGVQPSAAPATVRALSTDGEATVYLNGDFSRSFALAYRIAFAPAPANTSWSTVSILLLSGSGNGGSVSVGLSRGFPNAATLAGFTTSAAGRRAPVYRGLSITCGSTCLVELRGDATTISAFVEHRRVGRWVRHDLAIVRPAVQVNGEVAGVRDQIAATLRSVRTVAGGRVLRPRCAFTTQGVEPTLLPNGALTFRGTRKRAARVTYIVLSTRAAVDRCPP